MELLPSSLTFSEHLKTQNSISMVMEFSSLSYFTFWSLISIAFSIATTYSLSHTTILGHNTIAYFLLLSVNCCVSYAFLHRQIRQIGISYPVTWISLAIWESQTLIWHIIVWYWITVTYMLTKIYAFGLAIFFPDHKAFYIFLIFTSCFMIYVTLFPLIKACRDKIDLHFMIYFLIMHIFLTYLDSSLSINFEFVSLMQVVAVGYLSNVVVPVITGFGNYCTQGKFSPASVVPIKMHPNHFLCWILIQSLFMVSFRVCKKLHFLGTLQMLNLISYSVVIPGFFRVCASLFKGLVAKPSMAAKAYQQRRIVEIVCGMFANAVAQYYIDRVQSQALLLSCLFMAVAWLGNIANVSPATDFGVFQFFVSAALQCAVSLYGLHFYTFLVVIVGTALMVLRWKMESVLLSYYEYECLSFMRCQCQQQKGHMEMTRITVSNPT